MNAVASYIVILYAQSTNDLSVSRDVIGNRDPIMHINNFEITKLRKSIGISEVYVVFIPLNGLDRWYGLALSSY